MFYKFTDPNPKNNKNLSRNCNRCYYVKPLTDFDESKCTCRSCTSAKVNCPYCTSVVRYDGIRAHVKKQHPDVDIPKGFSRILSEKTINPASGNLLGRSTKLPLYTSLDGSTKDPIITLMGKVARVNIIILYHFLLIMG